MRSLLSDGIAGLPARATNSNSSASFVKGFRQRAAYVSVGEQKAIGVLYFFTASFKTIVQLYTSSLCSSAST